MGIMPYSQPVAISQLVQVDNQLNGESVISFDGSNDYFQGDYSTTFNNDDVTIFLVKKQAESNTQETFYSTNDSYGYIYLDITHWDNTEATYTYFNKSSSGADYYVSGAIMESNDFEI